jgi:hypothetical protein
MLPHGFKVQGGMLAITPFFAGREEQLVCAQVVVDNGHSGGRRRLCVDAGVQLYRQDLEETAKTLQIKLRFTNGETTVDTRHSGDLAVPRGEHLNFCSSPRVFGNSSSDMSSPWQNLQTLIQMGTARTTPVIVAQPVPVVTASLPVVRAYRETMTRLFDETCCLEPGWLYFC